MGVRGGNGNGFGDVSFTIVGTSDRFTIHHMRGRAIIRRDHSDGHLAFVVVITFRVIVIVIIDIHAIISHDLF